MSDLISREALLEEVKVWLNSHKDDDRNIFDLITNAPAVSGEFGISFMKYTEFGVVPDDYKNQAGGYRAGWNDCIASVKYTITTPQQPQSVADALEEAAKNILERKQPPLYPNEFDGGLMCYNEGLDLAVHIIRALIKRNAEGVE